MAKLAQLHEPPKSKHGLPEFPKFIARTKRVQIGSKLRWMAIWLCKCGTQFESEVHNVTSGHTLSCGCIQDQARRKSFPRHGHSRSAGSYWISPTYKSWQAMIARCTNSKHPAYFRYGGAGIRICESWRHDFSAFLADMGERPEGKTLDRYPNNAGNYEPGNCRWATSHEQIKNRRPCKRRSAFNWIECYGG